MTLKETTVIVFWEFFSSTISLNMHVYILYMFVTLKV